MEKTCYRETILHEGRPLSLQMTYCFGSHRVDTVQDLPAFAIHYGSRDRLYVWSETDLYGKETPLLRRMINRRMINAIFAKHGRSYIDTPSLAFFIEHHGEYNWGRLSGNVIVQPDRRVIEDVESAIRIHKPRIQWVERNGVIISTYEDSTAWSTRADFDFDFMVEGRKLHTLIYHPRYEVRRWFSDTFIYNTKRKLVSFFTDFSKEN